MLTKRAIELEKKFYQDMRKRYDSLLQRYPDGTIQARVQHGKKRLFFHGSRTDKHDKQATVYISEKRSSLIKDYFHRQILSRFIPVIDNNIALLTAMERSYKYFNDDPLAEIVAAQTERLSRKLKGSIHEELSVPVNLDGQAAGKSAANNDTIKTNDPDVFYFGYPTTNPFKPEHKIHRTPNGIMVRSKSELIIGSMLEAKGIRYDYEHLALLEGDPVYPDFTIRRETDGKTVLWEHFGLMSDDAYRAKNTQKVIRYLNCGYRLGNDLIITYDDDNGSIDMELLERIIGCML